MQVGRPQRRGRSIPVRTATIAAAAAATALALTACSGGAAPQGPGANSTSGTSAPGGRTSATAPQTSPSSSPAIITTSAVSARTISPTTPVTISIAHGTLTSVTMRNAAGKAVTGTMASDGSSWHNTEDLGYGKTYSVVATGKNAQGTPVTKNSVVKTVSPDNMTDVSLDRTGDYSLSDGDTYGVAIVPEMYFDENISSAADKAAAEKAITVTTSPHVNGAWAWQDDNRMLWRPENYWPSGTKVTIHANVYGVEFGNGLYGQQDKSTSFTIGRKQVTKAVDSAPEAVNKVRVYNAAGKVIKTMNTSMGEHDGTYANGQYINFYTLNGTYTVLEHDNPAIMSSDSYGLPASASGGYAPEPIYWATKISVDGIYLHELTTTIYAQDHGDDVSHGCLNLNTDNATWFYNHSLVGDPVEIKGNKKAPTIKVWQGGAWQVPWSTWTKGDLSNS